MKPLLTTQEVAEILKLNTRTVQRKLKAKEIPSFKIDGARRIDLEDLQKYIEKNKEMG